MRSCDVSQASASATLWASPSLARAVMNMTSGLPRDAAGRGSTTAKCRCRARSSCNSRSIVTLSSHVCSRCSMSLRSAITRGTVTSSGTTSRPTMRSARPSATLPLAAESGNASMSPTSAGAIHANNGGETDNSVIATTSPERVCSQCRRNNMPHGVAECLRLCVAQPESWPNRISSSCRPCIIIMIGAYSADKIVSASAPISTRIGLTVRRSSRLPNARRTPSNFGSSRTVMATMNSRIMRGLSNCGQRGNSESSSVKY